MEAGGFLAIKRNIYNPRESFRGRGLVRTPPRSPSRGFFFFFYGLFFTGCFHAALPPEHLENGSKHCVSLALEPPHAGFINSAPQLLPATVIAHNTNILNLTLKLSPHKIKTHGGHKGVLGPNFCVSDVASKSI